MLFKQIVQIAYRTVGIFLKKRPTQTTLRVVKAVSFYCLTSAEATRKDWIWKNKLTTRFTPLTPIDKQLSV